MIHIKNNNVVPFDIDETLILWTPQPQIKHINQIDVVCPNTNNIFWVTPHLAHINLLKQYKGRGFSIIVWSKSGDAWAKAVIDKLELNEYVDVILTKPDRYVDDKEDVAAVIGSRVYLPNWR